MLRRRLGEAEKIAFTQTPSFDFKIEERILFKLFNEPNPAFCFIFVLSQHKWQYSTKFDYKWKRH